MPTLHFTSGLPRSGSTLLAGLLRQNPRFAAAMTGPVGGLVTTLLNAMSTQNEAAVFLDEAKRRAILKAVVEAYYADQADREVVFDTNRMWCARLPLIRVLFPEARVLCCVRNVAWIMDSFERLVRRNAFEPSRLFGTADELATVYSRTEALAHRDRVVGFAYSPDAGVPTVASDVAATGSPSGLPLSVVRVVGASGEMRQAAVPCGSFQNVSWSNRSKRSGGSRVWRTSCRTGPETRCSPAAPSDRSNSGASYSTLAKSCGNHSSPRKR